MQQFMKRLKDLGWDDKKARNAAKLIFPGVFGFEMIAFASGFAIQVLSRTWVEGVNWNALFGLPPEIVILFRYVPETLLGVGEEEEYLQAIRQKLNAASAPPWKHDGPGGCLPDPQSLYILNDATIISDYPRAGNGKADANAAWIAESPTAARYLLNLLERYKQEERVNRQSFRLVHPTAYPGMLREHLPLLDKILHSALFYVFHNALSEILASNEDVTIEYTRTVEGEGWFIAQLTDHAAGWWARVGMKRTGERSLFAGQGTRPSDLAMDAEEWDALGLGGKLDLFFRGTDREGNLSTTLPIVYDFKHPLLWVLGTLPDDCAK